MTTELPRCCQQAVLDGIALHDHKPWRVAIPQLGSTDWHTQKEALDHADECQTKGFWVTVRYWSEGKWERYATFAPAQQDGGLFPAPDQTHEGGQHL